MNRTLKDNAELYQFLRELAQNLRDKRHSRLAENVETASLFTNGSPSKFLHESQIALKEVSRAEPVQIDIAQIRSAIGQIEEAFAKIGGA